MKKKVTFNDLAKETGFSKTTISRYFNQPDSLTTDTQKIIAGAVHRLGYKENKLARVLANGKSEMIGAIVPTLYMHYYAELLTQILALSDTYGYKFLVFSSEENRSAENKYLKELLAYKVEGLIVISHTTPSHDLAQLGIPVVTIEREDVNVNSVNCNNYQGGYAATSYLAELGCDILIHINGDLKKTSPAYDRIRSFRDAAAQYHIPKKEYLRTLGITYTDIRQNMSLIFEDIEKEFSGKKKGIFISNDTFANVLLNMIIQKYNTLPEEYQLIGFDDSLIASAAVIPITTIRQDTRLIAADAMDILVRLMNERKKRVPQISDTLVHHVVDTKLILRNTTGSDPERKV